MENDVFIKFSIGSFCMESIVVVSEINICILRFELGVRDGLPIGGAPKHYNTNIIGKSLTHTSPLNKIEIQDSSLHPQLSHSHKYS